MKSFLSDPLREFNRLYRKYDNICHELALAAGLSDSAFQILYALCNRGGSCPLHDICSLFGASKQTINSALRKLEETHMVYLESNGGRKKKACLTEHGREIVQHTVARLILEEDQILKSWTAKEQELYLSLTQRYLVSLRERVRSL